MLIQAKLISFISSKCNIHVLKVAEKIFMSVKSARSGRIAYHAYVPLTKCLIFAVNFRKVLGSVYIERDKKYSHYKEIFRFRSV